MFSHNDVKPVKAHAHSRDCMKEVGKIAGVRSGRPPSPSQTLPGPTCVTRQTLQLGLEASTQHPYTTGYVPEREKSFSYSSRGLAKKLPPPQLLKRHDILPPPGYTGQERADRRGHSSPHSQVPSPCRTLPPAHPRCPAKHWFLRWQPLL